MTDLPELSELCRPVPESERAWLDRDAEPAGLDTDPDARHWRERGYVIRRGIIPEQLVADYVRVREKADGWEREATPYMRVPELLALCTCPQVGELLEHLIGEPMGVHLNLCGWVSTERDWHADGYLNPGHAANRDHYAAVWFALGPITADCGPFEFVPGSHRWYGSLDQQKVIAAMLRAGVCAESQVRDGSWPRHSEKLLTPAFEREMDSRGVAPSSFLASAGDVLVWHPQLWHRGSPPAVPGKERRAMIAHYSGVGHREDMPRAVKAGGGWYFPLGGETRHLMKPKEAR